MQPMTPMNIETKTPPKETHGPAKGLPKPGEVVEKFVTKTFAIEALTRLDLSEPFKGALKALYDARGDWVKVEALYDASGYTQSQFAGMMGAFGRRMAYTEGFDDEAYFFDYSWDTDRQSWDYKLPETVIEAVTELGLV